MRTFKQLFILFALTASSAFSQNAPPPAMLSVPTTKVLAIGHLTVESPAPARQGVMPQEVQDTMRLYLAGKIDQWYVRKDRSGVVFILNVASVAEAQALLEQLPLGKAKLMQFNFIPIGPLSPLSLLLK